VEVKNILIDTNGYTAYKNGRPEAVTILQVAEQIGISVIVLGELLAGFAGGNRKKQNRQELAQFLSSPRVKVLLIDDQTTEYYARIFQQLKKDGRPIPTNDLWIAATAMQHACALFSFDNHFNVVTNLIICTSPEDLLP
jgi:tRNA(fMet)-specific endonuclease VapC